MDTSQVSQLETILNQISARMDTLSTQTEAALSTFNNKLEDISGRIPTDTVSPVSVVPPVENISAVAAGSRSLPRTQLPDTFNGSRSKTRAFLSQVHLYLGLHSAQFVSENTKVYFAASLLREAAFDWFEPFLRRANEIPAPEILNNFKKFCTEIEHSFGDLDSKATAERKLRSLVQTTSVSFYVTQFQQVVSHLDFNDEALSFFFYGGLKDHVKDILSQEEKPTSLDALVRKAILIDNRDFERRTEKKNLNTASRTQSTLPNAPPAMSQAPTKDTSTPMDLSQVVSKKREKLTETEKSHRIQNNLCLYCGNSGHKVAQCSLAPKKTVAAVSFATEIETISEKDLA